MSNFYFRSPEHKQQWLATLLRLGKVHNGTIDEEYGACLYILSASTSTWQQAQSYISREGIDIEGMLKEIDFSGAYSVLILLAGNLFNGNEHVDPVEFMRLDETNFMIALNAIMMRRGRLHLADFQ